MMIDVTRPQTKKVIASASIAGQTPGFGNGSEGRTVHSEDGSNGAGFEVSVAMGFFQHWIGWVD